MLDEFRSTLITWDKATSRIYSPVTANASDENGRKLVVQIVNGGQVEDLTGATLHLYWITRDKAHDGLDVFDAVDLKKGEFELSYTTGMLSNKGVLNANLVLIDTVGRVVSERFKITVTEGIDNDAIQSENSFTTLTQALIDISNLEQNYAPRLNGLTAQLQQTEQELKNTDSAVNKNTYELKPLVTFIDDDGRSSTYDKMYPLFTAKNEKFSFAVTSSFIGKTNYMSLNQIKELSDNGHEITAHGVTHDDIKTRLEQIGQSYNDFKSLGFDVKHHVYVGGGYNLEAIQENKRYFNSATTVEKGLNIAPLRTHALKRRAFGSFTSGQDAFESGSTLAGYKAMVDDAIARNGWLILMLHTWHPDHDATQQQYLSELIDYIQLKNVDIVTVQEGLDRFGNRIDVGDTSTDHFIVDAKGNIKSPQIDEMSCIYDNGNTKGYTNTSPYTAFKKNKTTISTFNTGSSSGFPVSHAGTLITNYYNNNYTVNQTWYPYNREFFYFRRWDVSIENWTIWSMIPIQLENEYPMIPGLTIGANTATEITIPFVNEANLSPNTDAIIVMPRGGLEAGIMFNVSMYTNKLIRLRLYNFTNNPVTLADRRWSVKVLKG